MHHRRTRRTTSALWRAPRYDIQAESANVGRVSRDAGRVADAISAGNALRFPGHVLERCISGPNRISQRLLIDAVDTIVGRMDHVVGPIEKYVRHASALE